VVLKNFTVPVWAMWESSCSLSWLRPYGMYGLAVVERCRGKVVPKRSSLRVIKCPNSHEYARNGRVPQYFVGGLARLTTPTCRHHFRPDERASGALSFVFGGSAVPMVRFAAVKVSGTAPFAAGPPPAAIIGCPARSRSS